MLQLTNSNESRAKATRRGVKTGKRPDKSVTHPAFKALVALNIIGAMVAAYLYFNREDEVSGMPAAPEQVTAANDGRRMSRQVNSAPSLSAERTAKFEEPEQVQEPVKTDSPVSTIKETPPATEPEVTVTSEPPPVTVTEDIKEKTIPEKQVTKTAPLVEPESNASSGKKTVSYTVKGPQVYFHNQPDESTRRNAFINRWNKAVLKPLDEKNGFVYIVYTNQWGQTSRGWMLKKYLTPIDKATD
jgi:hypothetical protein